MVLVSSVVSAIVLVLVSPSSSTPVVAGPVLVLVSVVVVVPGLVLVPVVVTGSAVEAGSSGSPVDPVTPS
ncbi:hypothetical protein [Nannocystis pusilla]|uniref:hypothetical protein n=1 Tax=Nannocystis pusilla TaxID=889268 RepID=UPI003B7A8506